MTDLMQRTRVLPTQPARGTGAGRMRLAGALLVEHAGGLRLPRPPFVIQSALFVHLPW
jgi:hypothetical protein